MIEKDIPRTFVSTDAIQNDVGRELLKTVCSKYIFFSGEDYIQGLSYIVAFTLNCLEYNAYNSFDLVTRMLNQKSKHFDILYKYIFKQDLNFFNDYVELIKKGFTLLDFKLSNKLCELDLPEYFWYGKWLITLFTYNFGFQLIVEIWDLLIARGIDSVVIVVLGIADYLKLRFMAVTDMTEATALIENFIIETNTKPKEIMKSIRRIVENKKFISLF